MMARQIAATQRAVHVVPSTTTQSAFVSDPNNLDFSDMGAGKTRVVGLLLGTELDLTFWSGGAVTAPGDFGAPRLLTRPELLELRARAWNVFVWSGTNLSTREAADPYQKLYSCLDAALPKAGTPEVLAAVREVLAPTPSVDVVAKQGSTPPGEHSSAQHTSPRAIVLPSSTQTSVPAPATRTGPGASPFVDDPNTFAFTVGAAGERISECTIFGQEYKLSFGPVPGTVRREVGGKVASVDDAALIALGRELWRHYLWAGTSLATSEGADPYEIVVRQIQAALEARGLSYGLIMVG